MSILLKGMLFFCVSLYLYGCATTGSDNWKVSNPGMQVWDERGDLMLTTERDDIYLYTTDSRTKYRLTDTRAISEFNPRFSRSGRTICYMFYEGGAPRYFVMKLDGSGKREISREDYRQLTR